MSSFIILHHYLIAKIAAERCGASPLQSRLFCIGSLIPDLSPMQFIHRHFYACSGEYVFAKLEKLSQSVSPFAMLTYGKMAHYMSDFCCSVHASGGVGDVREHILYERALNHYAVDNYAELKKEAADLAKDKQLLNILKDYYSGEKNVMHTDMLFSIKACIGVFMLAGRAYDFTEADFEVLEWIQKHLTCPFMDFIMPKITMLDDAGIVWIVAAVVMMAFKKSRKTGAMITAGLAADVLIGNLLLKNLIARQRPCWLDNSVHMLIAVPQDYSFPSGHTLASFTAAAIIAHFDKRLGAAAYVLAVLIAFSRLYLYVHFTTDVVAGALLGVLIGALIVKGFSLFSQHFAVK